ncbi:MAG: exonuclease subunit SbcD [Cytophagia bacterium]|nr:MAG: exonuclease subunit SbcD [Runella sp.]TAG17561.1 MAG: exonuclease subunit SbcD [Cytophagales bacterium]TAG37975.1 MAG: exonuclease subunit SbcD [Cytophagia bacterium]TAG78123.1 MAG: exonuclease subunit SbcD [Cytophagales bacterium]
MKILHTADWHIGKQLHRYGLDDDHALFLDWLAALIQERQIDLLLVSGDVFDTANPSNASLAQYYGFLKQLIGTGCQVIVTGGNHDSPGVLNAPRELLRFLDVKVVGCISNDLSDELIHVQTPRGELVVGAVPYLREIDLRRSASGQGYDERVALVRQGIRQHYQALADLKHEQFKNLPSIAMGHLYVNGATVSESEREIHVVGGEAAFSSEHFPAGFDYTALGHIHRPQRIGNSDFTRYCGSPIMLSFSEREDAKLVLELTLENDKITQITPLPVPKFRELRSFKGSLDEVWADLQAYAPTAPLEALVEVRVEEPNSDPQIELNFELLKQEFAQSPFKIISPRIAYSNRLRGADELFVIGTAIQDLAETEVFEKRLLAEDLDEATRQTLLEAFGELLQEVQESN